MPERFGAGEWPDPDSLPHHLRRLHRRINAARRAERDPDPSHVDQTGRTWPGLVEPDQDPQPHPHNRGAP